MPLRPVVRAPVSPHDDSAKDKFRRDVLRGLARSQKQVPSKYLYDEQGSALFDDICELDEYYPTRTEMGILRRDGGEMAAALGPECLLIEYGAGSSRKIRFLLDHLRDLVAYVPVDISGEHLHAAADRLAGSYPDLDIRPICADFTESFSLPVAGNGDCRRVVFFPGSTIGNFSPEAARRLLRRTADTCGKGGALLIGADLKKDRETLERAYNDESGVTAAFNMNLLTRINRELDGNFSPSQFEHQAPYVADKGRIEMHLVSKTEQTVRVGAEEFTFSKGESIHTECSHKQSLDGFRGLADGAGFDVGEVWTDDRKRFSVWYLVAR